MVNCVQLHCGTTRNFTRGYATMNTFRVYLHPGEALVINKGVNSTTFVKCGKRAVRKTRIVWLKLGQTVIVKCKHKCH